MKKALIDPNGNFVEVAASEFPVAAPFFWVDVADDVTPQTHVYDGSAIIVRPAPLRDEAAMIASVKAEAQRRIYAEIPAWKQANLTARSAELLRLRLDAGTWTPEQQTEADAIEVAWAWTKAVRTRSNELEVEIVAGGSPDITQGWPQP